MGERKSPMGYRSPYSPHPLWPTRALTPDGCSSMGAQQGSQCDGSQDHDLGPAPYVFKVYLQWALWGRQWGEIEADQGREELWVQDLLPYLVEGEGMEVKLLKAAQPTQKMSEWASLFGRENDRTTGSGCGKVSGSVWPRKSQPMRNLGISGKKLQ